MFLAAVTILWTSLALGRDVPLADAIKDFNEKAATHPIGKDQPALTESEVIAAIRATEWTENLPVSKEMFEYFKQIGETRRMPPDAEFVWLAGLDPGGAFVFDMWSIRLKIRRADGSSYEFELRKRMVGSRTLKEELAREEKMLREAPALPGTYRLKERVESLRARIAKMNN